MSDEFGPGPRKGWTTPVGLLSVIFGTIACVFTAAGIGLMPVWAGMVEGQLNGASLPPNMRLTPMLLAAGVLGVAVNGLLIVAGISTMLKKAVGSPLHLTYALASVASLFFGTYVQMQVQADMVDWAKQYPDNDFVQQMAAQQGGSGAGVALIAGIGVSLAWPVFCIIWFGMMKKSPKLAAEDLAAS